MDGLVTGQNTWADVAFLIATVLCVLVAAWRADHNLDGAIVAVAFACGFFGLFLL